MRILRQRALVCAILVIGAPSTGPAQEVLPDPNVTQTGHLFHKGEQPACPDVKVIVETESAQAAPKTDSSTPPPARRCCFLRKHLQCGCVAGGGYNAVGSYGAVANFVYTPALINLNQGTTNVVSPNFGASIDLSGLRSLQEMEMHAAAFGAQQAAQQAAREHMDQALSRLQSSLQKYGASSGKAAEGAGTDTTLNVQLAKIDNRLKGLEDIVKAHHDTLALLVQMAPKKAQGTISATLKDNQFTLNESISKQDMPFMVDDPEKVRVIEKDKLTDKKLKDVLKGVQVTVTYEKVGDKAIVKEIRIEEK